MDIRLPQVFRGSLRRHLMLLVLVALVPMLVWAGGLTLWNSRSEARQIERGLSETVRALATAVDQEVALTTEALKTLGPSSSLRQGDIPAFRARAAEVVARHPLWTNIVLVDMTGQQMVNTAVAEGASLPSIEAPGYEAIRDAFAQVASTGEPAVSDLTFGPVMQRQLVAVGVPVTDANGRITHVLMAGLMPEKLADLLGRQLTPKGWIAAIADGRGQFVARSYDHANTVGRPVPAWLREASALRRRGTATGQSMEGHSIIAAFERSRYSSWIITYGAPTSFFQQGLASTALWTIGFGLAVLAASSVLALAIGKRILLPVQALSHAAEGYIRDPRPEDSAYEITELDTLNRALGGLAGSLDDAESRFRQLFAMAPAMLDVLDANSRLVEVNDTWVGVLGYAREEVLGRYPWEFQTPESRAYVQAVVLPRLLATGRIEDIPVKFVAKSGEVRDIQISARVEHDQHGRVVRILGALRDVTEQRRVEKALAEAREAAERANEGKTRFLAAASHDLRQPLQALSLYVDTLSTRLGEREGELMQGVHQCVDSLSGMLADMLDVARLDAGTIEIKPADVPVRQLLERGAAAWRIQAANKGLRLDVVSCDTVVRTDPGLMERLLSNLVSNAVRYTDRGRILVGCRRCGAENVRIEVWDTGIGIPADKLGTVFEEFRQLGNPERRADKGTGLGLAIVERIARRLGHGVSVRSEPGRGSVFSVTVARARGRPTVAPRLRPVAPAERPRRIAVVEDEIHVRHALEMVLSALGHAVGGGETAEEAMAALAGPPEFIIADYRLREGRTGLDAIRAIRNRFGQVPALILTGDTDPAVIRHISSAGLSMLHKPLQVDALRNLLDAA